MDANTGDVLCVAVVLVMATVLTKRVSQYQTYSISSLQRHQYQVESFKVFLSLKKSSNGELKFFVSFLSNFMHPLVRLDSNFAGTSTLVTTTSWTVNLSRRSKVEEVAVCGTLQGIAI